MTASFPAHHLYRLWQFSRPRTNPTTVRSDRYLDEVNSGRCLLEGSGKMT